METKDESPTAKQAKNKRSVLAALKFHFVKDD